MLVFGVMDASNVARGLIPAAVAIGILLARRFIPVRDGVEVTAGEARDLAKIKWRFYGVVALVGGCVGWLSFELLVAANWALALFDPKPAFLLLPTRAMWGAPPFLMGICLMWELSLRVWSRFVSKWQARKLEAWLSQKDGIDGTRLFRLVFFALALPAFLVAVLALPMHTSVSDSGLRMGHFARFPARHYNFSDVQSITVPLEGIVQNDSFVDCPTIVLGFSNGDHWSSTDNRECAAPTDALLLAYLQTKTGLAAKHTHGFR